MCFFSFFLAKISFIQKRSKRKVLSHPPPHAGRAEQVQRIDIDIDPWILRPSAIRVSWRSLRYMFRSAMPSGWFLATHPNKPIGGASSNPHPRMFFLFFFPPGFFDSLDWSSRRRCCSRPGIINRTKGISYQLGGRMLLNLGFRDVPGVCIQMQLMLKP